MEWRRFIALGAIVAIFWPLPAAAQQPAMPVIGFLSSASRDADARELGAFIKGLNQAGYVEGQNVAIEYRWAENRFERLPAMAADLVRRDVAVIAVIGGTITALAAKAATAQIPIVAVIGGDPVKSGLVASLNRPGGNITGVSLLAGFLDAKRLELLHEVVPKASVIAVLRNPNNPNADPEQKDLQAAARTKGLQIRVLNVASVHDIDAANAVLAEQKAGALVVGTDPFLNRRIDQIVALAARHSLPAIYGYREFPEAGGLMSYGTSATDARRLLGIYVARILKGEKPTDLPVQQATKIELVLNLKTAKSLGLAFPLPLLGRADDVIE